ncbi:MAG: LysR family transcriptional regulator [Gammaproteobacteria bacterium]|nr:MAG: LysR family transcriptional regulator [Gammaproteobacteria bacterium]
MNSDLLRTFLEVSKTRHFGRAAENLFLTQSAVSFRIAKLEEIMGVVLFTRERNNVLLTPSGERLLPHAGNILAAWQAALQDVGVAAVKNFQLSLGGTSNLWDAFLQSVLPRMAQHYPNMYIRTEINSQQEMVRALLGRRLDIAVAMEPATVAELNTAKIGQLDLILVSHKPIDTISEVKAAGFVFIDWGTALNLQQAHMFEEAIAPILHTGQSHIALEFILSHGGAAYLPGVVAEPYLVDKTLFEVKDINRLSCEVYAIYNESSDRSKNILPIVDFLKSFHLSVQDNGKST